MSEYLEHNIFEFCCTSMISPYTVVTVFFVYIAEILVILEKKMMMFVILESIQVMSVNILV
jgi:hypothetical protein